MAAEGLLAILSVLLFLFGGAAMLIDKWLRGSFYFFFYSNLN
jgi:hypothetical protein